MITLKQWKEFNEYRDRLFKEVLNSKEYNDIQKKREDIQSPTFTVKKKKFWTGEIVEKTYAKSPYYYYLFDILDLEMLEFAEKQLFSHIPNKTIEACLDWLITTKHE